MAFRGLALRPVPPHAMGPPQTSPRPHSRSVTGATTAHGKQLAAVLVLIHFPGDGEEDAAYGKGQDGGWGWGEGLRRVGPVAISCEPIA